MLILTLIYVSQRAPKYQHRGRTEVSVEAVKGDTLRISSEYFSYPYFLINYLIFFIILLYMWLIVLLVSPEFL